MSMPPLPYHAAFDGRNDELRARDLDRQLGACGAAAINHRDVVPAGLGGAKRDRPVGAREVVEVVIHRRNKRGERLDRAAVDPETLDFGMGVTLVAALLAVISTFYLPGPLLALVRAAAAVVSGGV